MDSTLLTDWLRAAGAGDHAAKERAYNSVYGELRRLAGVQLAGGNHQTLTPTVLVSEAYLRLANGALAALNDRMHIFNLAARAMRQTVVDYARERMARKRGGDWLCTQLEDQSIPDQAVNAEQALAIEQALAFLEQQDTQLAETLSLNVFAGLSSPKIAQLRSVSERSVQRELVLARNYLRLVLERQ